MATKPPLADSHPQWRTVGPPQAERSSSAWGRLLGAACLGLALTAILLGTATRLFGLSIGTTTWTVAVFATTTTLVANSNSLAVSRS